jgi:hypothetical protein
VVSFIRGEAILRKKKPSASAILTFCNACLVNDDIGETGIGADRWRIKQEAIVNGVRIAPENLTAGRV